MEYFSLDCNHGHNEMKLLAWSNDQCFVFLKKEWVLVQINVTSHLFWSLLFADGRSPTTRIFYY